MKVKRIAVSSSGGETGTLELPGAEHEAGLETVKRIAVRTRTGEVHTLELPREDPRIYLDGAHILFRATVGENTLHLRQQVDGFDCTVHWGDGTRTAVPSDGGLIAHNYARAGDYHIFVTGNAFAGFHVNGDPGAEKYIAAYSMGKWKRDTMTTARRMFAWCNNLVEVGDDLFRYCGRLSDFQECFLACTQLHDLPGDLFRYNMEADNFAQCFLDCEKLVLREDLFGIGNETTRFAQVSQVDLRGCFTRNFFTEGQGKAPALWNYTFQSVDKTGCFSGVGNNAETLSNYGEIPQEWKEASA